VEDSHLKKLPIGTMLILASVRVDVRFVETDFTARKGSEISNNVRRDRTTVESPLRAIVNVTGPGLNQMNGKRSAADRIPADDSWLRAIWRAVHAFNRATPNGINKRQ
jgi:hypothetical protein